MKKGIHPKYELAIVRCACGSEVEIRTTTPGINVEICSNCHPFFTGKQKLLDSAGRVDRFRKRYGMDEAQTTAETVAKAKAGDATREQKKKAAPAKTAAGKAAPAKKMKSLGPIEETEGGRRGARPRGPRPPQPKKVEKPAA